ncbi:MAG: peptidoglycan glycosyltransferase [Lachnospiraceae bacterium]|nr:peptidoglycan glycosyltransferase [Lachnospiraceae bacterium]
MAARGKRKKNRKKSFPFLFRMKKKLAVLFVIVIGCLAFLVGRLVYIDVESGDRYEKIVLSNQEYSSTTIPYRRGDITDRRGTVLATSTDVYNMVLDCSIINYKEEYLEPTLEALAACFGEDDLRIVKDSEGNKTQLTYEMIRAYITNNPDSTYYVLAEDLTYEEVEAFEAMQEENSLIKGIWFEKEYVREYPYGSLASALIGYTASGNVGVGGIEDSYNDVLNGTDGRRYGYLNSDSNYEVAVKNAVNGETVVSTIDANLQTIVEEKILEFYDTLTDNAREGGGAEHIAVIMMDPDTGEVLAMADYPNYDYTILEDEETLSSLSQYYSEDEWGDLGDTEIMNLANLSLFNSMETIEEMDSTAITSAVEALKQNFCITYTYEPGSTAKPFTIACGLDTGTITEDMTFYCDGYEQISGHTIHCVNRSGHGMETLSETLENSCNDALMQISYRIGASNFAKYQQLFNFGLKTNIDLPGEARTSSLIYTEENLMTINLATNAFGQNFNVTMIQMISAYSSIVNGGNYYLPHVALEIQDEDGNTVESIEPTLLKRTVSEETSATLISYLANVVEQGTGSTAKVDGYSMCGKTGTAEKYILDEDGNATGVRADGEYVVSFIGSVPAEDPEIVIYAVVDAPNVEDQAHSSYAQNVVREILKEALPYLNIYPDQELTGINTDKNIIGETEGAEGTDADETAQTEADGTDTDEADNAAADQTGEIGTDTDEADNAAADQTGETGTDTDEADNTDAEQQTAETGTDTAEAQTDTGE